MDAHDSTMHEEQDPSRLWHYLALFLAAIGLVVALYGVNHHRQVASHGRSNAVCNINSTVNCDAVASSTYSHFLTVPWVIWGTAYFFTILLLLYFSLKRIGNRQEHLLAYTLCVPIGVLVSIILAYISFNVMGLTCLICMTTYAVNFSQAGLLWYGIKRKYIDFSNLNVRSLYSGIVSATLGFSAVLITYNIIGEQDLIRPVPAEEEMMMQSQLPPQQQQAPVQNIPVSLNAYSGLGEDYRKGPDDAKVRIIIFSDFECPACANVSAALEEIYQSFPGKVQLVYRNYPLDNACNPILQHKKHEHACALASLARCAGRFGKFWAYHDLAFEKQSELNSESPKKWAKAVGLNDEQIASCIKDKSVDEKIKDDIDFGTKLGIDATPTVFVNGRRVLGSFQELKDEIKKMTES